MATPGHTLVSAYDACDHKVSAESDVLADILNSVEEQLLVVSVIGPYQMGKSSFISHLTGDTNIQIGNGTEVETKGVYLYGPYSLNELKRRWQVPEVPGDPTKIVFFDTEGFQGNDVGLSQEENKLIMCQMLAPYIAISQVCIMMHRANLGRGSSEMIKYFFEVAQKISRGANTTSMGQDHMNLVDLSTDFSKYLSSDVDEDGQPVPVVYRPDTVPESYDEACKYLRAVQGRRLCSYGNSASASPSPSPSPSPLPFMEPEGIPASESTLFVDEFWPLPTFDACCPISEQAPRFQTGFMLVSQRLIGMLDSLKRAHRIGGHGAYAAFELFRGNMSSANLEELARKARSLAELSTDERIVRPLIDQIIAGAKISMEIEFKKFKQMLDAKIAGTIDEVYRIDGVSDRIKCSEAWRKQISAVEEQLNQAKSDCIALLSTQST